MIQEITKLLIDFQKIPKRNRNRTFMEISGYPHYENVCSNILKFYFEHENEHNLDDLLLKSLFQASLCDIDNEYICENIVVEREVTTLQNNRLDLLIETDEYIIGIENKIFHFLHNDLSDYSETIDNKAKTNKKKTLKIVLSLNKVNSPKIKKNDFINVTYPDFFNSIQNNFGDYILTGHNDYIIHLKGFITTINNLTGNNMENKELNLFFEQNAKNILELTSEFNKYQNEIYAKVYQLKALVSKNEYASNSIKQWIVNKHSLVHDYLINDFQVSVDTPVSLDGWEIQLFGKNIKSKDFIFNVMCNNPEFLGKPIKEFRIERNRLVFANFKVDDIEGVAETLIDLLKRIEKYLKDNTTQQ